MKKINYEEIIKEAKRKEQSPYTIIKRMLNYREPSDENREIYNELKCCRNCKNINTETIDRKTHTGQCEVIGEGFNDYSNINLKFTCDNHNK